MAKRSGLDLRKYVVLGIQAELTALKATQRMLEAQLARLTRGRTIAAQGAGAATQASGGGLVGNGRKRRRMSAAARKRISDAQKARWAKHRAMKK